VEFCTTLIGHDPFFLHLQVAEADLVDDPWNNFWCALRGNEIFEVPPIPVTKDGVGQKGKGDIGIQQGEEDRQSVAEDDHEDGEKPETTIREAGERREHIDDTSDAKRMGAQRTYWSCWSGTAAPLYTYSIVSSNG